LVLGGSEIERAFARHVLYTDQFRRSARLFESFRDDDSDRLVVVFNLGTAQQLGGIKVARDELAGVLRSDDCKDAGRRFGLVKIDRRDPSFRDGSADDVAIRLVWNDIVLLIGITRSAGGLERAIDAVSRPSNDFQLINRVRDSGSFELHG
jgi:hypothetical protein